MASLDLLFGDVLGQLDEIIADAKAIVDKRTNWEAKVGWEIADGQFTWVMSKEFNTKEEAQKWMNPLIKSGKFDDGQIERKLLK